MGLAEKEKKKKKKQQHPPAAAPGPGPGPGPKAAAAGGASLMSMYREAQELLSRRPITAEAFHRLDELRKHIRAALAHGKPNQQHPQTGTDAGGKAVPYPALEDPRFNRALVTKKEFNQALQKAPPAGGDVEQLWQRRCRPGEFVLTQNQQFIRNFISPYTPYNGMLLFHGVGVGKTCAAVTVAEQFADKKVLVLVQPGLKSNFRSHVFDFDRLRTLEEAANQSADAGGDDDGGDGASAAAAKVADASAPPLRGRRYDGKALDLAHAANQCTGTKYLNMLSAADLHNKELAEKKIRRLVDARYKFMGTHVFGKLVRTLQSSPDGADRINREFSDHVIIVDEAHHLRVTRDVDNKLVTSALRTVLRYSEGVKLLLLTATPMFNESKDVLELVNLLLINDRRRPLHASEVFDKDGNLTQSGERTLVDATRGYVSYMRGEDPFSFPVRLDPRANRGGDTRVMDLKRQQPRYDIKGQAIPPDRRIQHTQLVVSKMDPYQRAIYRASERAMIADEAVTAATARTALGNGDDDEDDGDGGDDEEAGAEADGDADVGGDEEEDGEAGAGAAAKAAASSSSAPSSGHRLALSQGFGISNVVYPADKVAPLVVGEDVRPFYGQTGFMNCFERLPGRGLRFKYRTPSLPFLAYKHLATYAPKLKTILDYILRSEDIVFVYSKFLWSGLIPLAIALEHAGFTRYGAGGGGGGPILGGGGGVAKPGTPGAVPAKKKWTYVALTAQKQDFSMTYESDIEACRSDANAGGDVVKVILASEKASEGLDFKNIREVHILDPWFHFNKIEQIVGRASRNCSHAALPLEKRNVTVFMHVAVAPDAPAAPAKGGGEGEVVGGGKKNNKNRHRNPDGKRKSEAAAVAAVAAVAAEEEEEEEEEATAATAGSALSVRGRESIDVRAYRIAEIKQRRIARVEAILRGNAVDCNLNKPVLFYDPQQLRMRTTVVTSQGTVLRDYVIGDRWPRWQRPHCLPDVNPATVKVDESTFEPYRHSGGVDACKAVFRGMFRQGVVFTVDDISAACRREHPDVSRDAIMLAIHEVVEERSPVANPAGRGGYVIYASDKYIFQPSAAFDERVAIEDRSADGTLDSADSYPLRVRLRGSKAGDEGLSKSRSSSAAAAGPSGAAERGRRTRSAASALVGSAAATRNRGGVKKPPSGTSSTRGSDHASSSSPTGVALEARDLAGRCLEAVAEEADRGGSTFQAAVDAVVDRFTAKQLRRAVQAVVAAGGAWASPKKKKRHGNENNKGDAGGDALPALERSLRAGGVLGRLPDGTWYMYDYFRGSYLYYDDRAGKFEPCSGPLLVQVEQDDTRGAAMADMVDRSKLRAYMAPQSGGTGAKFKVLGVLPGSSGCVCHQTSTLRVNDIVDLVLGAIDLDGPGGRSNNRNSRAAARARLAQLDKRKLCEVFELLLRRSSNAAGGSATTFGAVARPALASRIFTQRGKRFIVKQSSSSSPRAAAAGAGPL